MPSQRRIRVVAIVTVLLMVVLFYTHHSSKQSDKQFYDRTVQGIQDREAAAAKARSNTEAKLNIQSLDSKEQVQAAAEKSRLEGAQEEHRLRDEEVQKKAALKSGPSPKDSTPNASPLPGAAKKWDMGDDEAKPAKKEQTEEEKDVEAELNAILKRSPIIIFSKTYCPHSKRAKSIFEKYAITPSPHIVELDEHKLGPQLQSQLQKLTGRRTVPNVLVTGHSIGGGDDIAELHEKDELMHKIKALAGKRIVEIGLKKPGSE